MRRAIFIYALLLLGTFLFFEDKKEFEHPYTVWEMIEEDGQNSNKSGEWTFYFKEEESDIFDLDPNFREQVRRKIIENFREI